MSSNRVSAASLSLFSIIVVAVACCVVDQPAAVLLLQQQRLEDVELHDAAGVHAAGRAPLIGRAGAQCSARRPRSRSSCGRRRALVIAATSRRGRPRRPRPPRRGRRGAELAAADAGDVGRGGLRGGDRLRPRRRPSPVRRRVGRMRRPRLRTGVGSRRRCAAGALARRGDRHDAERPGRRPAAIGRATPGRPAAGSVARACAMLIDSAAGRLDRIV